MTLFTIGHSNHEIDKFIDLLRCHQIEMLVDVRSSPHSRYAPQYNMDALRNALDKQGIHYLPPNRLLRCLATIRYSPHRHVLQNEYDENIF